MATISSEMPSPNNEFRNSSTPIHQSDNSSIPTYTRREIIGRGTHIAYSGAGLAAVGLLSLADINKQLREQRATIQTHTPANNLEVEIYRESVMNESEQTERRSKFVRPLIASGLAILLFGLEKKRKDQLNSDTPG